MVNEAENHEGSSEIFNKTQLIDAAESFLTNPLTDTDALEDGSIERTLSTAKVDKSAIDPIELTGISHGDTTAYTLTEWSGLDQRKYYWSSDAKGNITVSTTDHTGLLSEPSTANNPFLALGTIQQGLDRLQAAPIPQQGLKNRVSSALGKLVGHKVG